MCEAIKGFVESGGGVVKKSMKKLRDVSNFLYDLQFWYLVLKRMYVPGFEGG